MALGSIGDLKDVQALAQKVLDCPDRMDARARKAIDLAFRGGSSDPVVHAAALRTAFAEASGLRLSRSHVRSWMFGLNELINQGQLDAAAYALTGLRAVFPDRAYLQTMSIVFERLPPVVDNGREAFVDDPDSDVQIVRTPGSDTVLLDFCGATHRPGIPIHLMDRWLARLGCHVIYLRDRRQIGYTAGIPALGGDQAETVDGLRKVAGDLGVRRIVCLGNSAGGSGALRYAQPLGAERVLSFVPITGGQEYTDEVAPHTPKGAPLWWGDLAALYDTASGVQARILYGEKNEGDRQQCTRMAGLPGVVVESLPDWDEHHLFVGLLLAERLDEVLEWLVSGGW